MGTDPILELSDVIAGYGDMTILNGTTLKVRRATITTIIGPNGAGKSTVFKAVFGLLKIREGSVRFNGADITNSSPRDLLAQGIGEALRRHAAGDVGEASGCKADQHAYRFVRPALGNCRQGGCCQGGGEASGKADGLLHC